MGNCVSFQPSCDEALNHIFKCLFGKGYIRTLKENLMALEREMEDLKAIQHVVKNKVAREEETRHRKRLETVKVWLTRFERIDTKFNKLLSTSSVQLQKLCLCGFCSKNVWSSYNYGKTVFLLLEEVKKLKSEGNFEVVAEPVLRYEVEERPTQPTIGHEIMLEKAWNRLMEDGVGFMGLHGMGGVGKTTLFKKIHNKFAKMTGKFDVVIWVMVSQGAKISKLQEDIAKKLYLWDEVWKNKDESDKATNIHIVLKGKRFVLMLDDIWEKVDLEAIGVPFPTRENGCKVAFTTRSLDVCGRMGDHEAMQVDCLEPDEAWELFKTKVVENTLKRDPVIPELAKKVAEKCQGLPLALSVIGETMALWIASDFGKQKESFVVQAGVGLHEVPKVKDWEAVRRMSLMDNYIKDITCGSKCSELTTLFLQKNSYLKNLSGDFIRSMQKLVVLDLSSTDINELPEEISELASLQFLDLSGTWIKILPVGFQKLKKLTHLNLSYTNCLCSLGGMSTLQSLRVLKLEDSNGVDGNVNFECYSDEIVAEAEVSLVKKLQLLENLEVLTITLTTDLGLEQILGDQRLANCINGMRMNDFRQKPLNISLLAGMVNLCELSMQDTHVSEINTYKNCRESRTDWSDVHNPTSPCFTNLSLVFIKDLTWLLFAPNLVDLSVLDSLEVEEIIKKEKATNLTGITPFQKLEVLSVHFLPKLESIY